MATQSREVTLRSPFQFGRRRQFRLIIPLNQLQKYNQIIKEMVRYLKKHTSNLQYKLHQTPNLMFLVSSCCCLCPIHWSQVLSREWRCSWSSADSRCSNYIWVINNFTASGATYIYNRFEGNSLALEWCDYHFNSLALGICNCNFQFVILNTLLSLAFPIKFAWGVWHRELLMISQYWFR